MSDPTKPKWLPPNMTFVGVSRTKPYHGNLKVFEYADDRGNKFFYYDYDSTTPEIDRL